MTRCTRWNRMDKRRARSNRTILRPLRCVELLLIVMLSGAGCGGNPDDVDRVSSTPGREGPGVSLPELVDAALHRPPEQDSLAMLDRLHTPGRIHLEPHENVHVPHQVDTLRTYHYPGLQFTVYDVTGSAKEIVQHIAVTGSSYATEEGIRVGMRRSQVRSALGPPDAVTDSMMVYRLSDVTPNHFRVGLENERVARMEWDIYVD